MIRYSKLENKPRIFKSLTGLTPPASLELLEKFIYKPHYEDLVMETACVAYIT